MSEDKNFRHKQQDLTELNADGNRERGRDGEEVIESDTKVKPVEGADKPLTDEELLKKKIEELRKRDPFIYR